MMNRRCLHPSFGILATLAIAVATTILPATAFSQEAFIRSDLSVRPDAVAFGDPFTVTVTVEWSGEYKVESILPPKSSGLLLIDQGMPMDASNRANESKNQCNYDFTFRAVQSGSTTIPSFTVQYRMGDGGDLEILQSPTATVSVRPVETDAAKGELSSLTPPESIEFSWTLRNLVIAGVVLLVFLVGASIFIGFVLWLSRRQERASLVPPRPPHEVALERLEALARSTWPQDGQYKEFCTELSDIVRGYIQGRYGVPALDWTTSELLMGLESRQEPDAEIRKDLQGLLDLCDLVKFAKWEPPVEAMLENLEVARRWVNATRSIEPQQEEAAA